MKTAALWGFLLFGAWFWRQPRTPHRHEWPEGLPVFSGGRADCAYTLANGSAFASFTTAAPAAEVLASARAAFTGEGWVEIPLALSDTRFFMRGEAVAVLLAESTGCGTRVTVLQRPRGL
ncbi:MAG: hypothetical protein ACI4Q3_02650 [Kiritimatiellia bacterium]